MSGSNSEESEETISQYLQEHGLLEEGMSAGDKRNLWEVIKLSQDTAHAEEQDRQKRARHNLQFDEVSSRSDDGTREEENIPIVVAVTPHQRANTRDSPQQNTATVHPFRYSPTSTLVSSSSRAVVAPSQQSSLVDSPKQIIEPSARRSFRLKPNESFSVSKNNQEKCASPEGHSSISNKQNVSSPRNLKNPLSTRNIQNVPSPGQIQRNVNISSSGQIQNASSPRNNDNVPSPTTVQNPPSPEKEHECESISQSERREATPRRWSEVVKPNLPSTCSSMELPHDESPTSSDHESSPIRKIRQGFNLSLKFSQSEENNEECCALNEKEKSETVPSPANEPPSSPVNEKKVVNDRERNINAFDCDRSNYGLTLKVRKPRKMCSRLPFYIPPRKMDVHSYIAYFKKCVNDHAAKLLEVQKRSHKCIPWGDPVVVEEINSKSYATVDQKNRATTLQRYNFRDRRVTSQKVNTIYEDSNSQNDIKTQEQTNDAIFDSLLDDKSSDGTEIINKEEPTGNSKSSTATPERQGSKRKSESSDEMEEKRSAAGTWLSTVNVEDDEVAVKRKKLGTVCYDRGWKDVDSDGSSNKQPSQQLKQKRGRRRLYNVSTKKTVCYAKTWEDVGINIDSDEGSPNEEQVQRKRGRRRIYRIPTKKKETVDEDETVTFAEINVEEATSEINTQREVDIVRPAPVKLRRNGRRRVQQASQQQQNEEDVTVIFETAKSDNSNKEQEMEVPCPICRVSYPAKDIEAHASECNEYCAEDIPEDEEQSASPQAPSQDCWSQYDGVHEGSTQGTAASKHSFGAT